MDRAGFWFTKVNTLSGFVKKGTPEWLMYCIAFDQHYDGTCMTTHSHPKVKKDIKLKRVHLLSWKSNPQTGEVEPYITIEVVAAIMEHPYGTQYYRGPHWHVVYEGGFRTNWPKSAHTVLYIGRER